MMKTIVFLLMLAASGLAGAELVVQVEGVRNGKGKVRGLVFTKAGGFPNDHNAAAAKTTAGAKPGTVLLRFGEVAAQRGSIVVLHDEDGDGKLDKNFVGIPKEGLGTSNWAKRSKPKFEPTVVDLQKGKPIVIRLRYP